MKEKLKKRLDSIANIVFWIMIVCVTVVLLYAGGRILVCDQFIVPSKSMIPTLIPSDRILANKLIFGARIYKNYDFSEGQPLESWRMPRLRKIRPNDVLVFNIPRGYDRDKIEFKINYVFAKRCVGTPGDTIRIEKGFYKNNLYDKIIGVKSEQQRLFSTPDSLMPDFVLTSIPHDGKWTIKEFGPLYVPAKGDTVRLDSRLARLYKIVIEYEMGTSLFLYENGRMLDDTLITEYVFKNNYYFMGGDNVLDSNDSRYWGFMPEEFIVGVAKRISYSRDRNIGEFRWDRLWRRIDRNLETY